MSAPSSPAPTVIVQSPSGAAKFFAWVGWILFLLTGAMLFVCFLMLVFTWAALADQFDTTNGITEKHVSGGKLETNKIAIISVEGVIMEGQGFVKHQIDKVRDDKNVKAIVLRVDSPGGTVTGSDYILHHLTKLREDKQVPIVVSMGSMAASGGYYVAMAVGDEPKSIYAEPTTTTGSIGVIIPHYDITGLMEKYDIKDDSIASHDRKQMLSMTKKLDGDKRELVQAYVMEAFERFKDIVKQGRPDFRANPEKLDVLATGEIFSATKAKANGLVDELGFQEDAIARAAELASLSADDYRVVKYERPATLLDLGSIGGANAARSEINAILELSIPRAYYLNTMLPAAFASRRAD